MYQKGISWNISDGMKIHLWDDNRIEASHSLRQVTHNPIHKSEINLLVITFDNPLDMKASIITTYTQKSSHKIDTYFWNQSVDGKFNTKSVYELYLSNTRHPYRSTIFRHDLF